MQSRGKFENSLSFSLSEIQIERAPCPSVRIFACCSDDVGVCRLFSDVTCRGMREHHRGGDGDGVMRRGGRVD